MAKKQRKVSPFECVWYTLCSLTGVWGVTFIVLGLIGKNQLSDGALYKASHAWASIFGLDYIGWGIIYLALAAVASLIVLLIYASKTDRAVEKETRRAARLAAANLEQSPVVDAEVAPVEK